MIVSRSILSKLARARVNPWPVIYYCRDITASIHIPCTHIANTGIFVILLIERDGHCNLKLGGKHYRCNMQRQNEIKTWKYVGGTADRYCGLKDSKQLECCSPRNNMIDKPSDCTGIMNLNSVCLKISTRLARYPAGRYRVYRDTLVTTKPHKNIE